MALPETLRLVPEVSNWSVSDYCARYERLLNARRFMGMFSNDRSETMTERRGMLHDTNIDACERRWSSFVQWCADTTIPAVSFEMPFIHHGDEVAHVCLLYTLSQRYHERLAEGEGLSWMVLCCCEPPYNKFYLVCDAVYWWCDLDLERWQSMNVRGRRLVG